LHTEMEDPIGGKLAHPDDYRQLLRMRMSSLARMAAARPSSGISSR